MVRHIEKTGAPGAVPGPAHRGILEAPGWEPGVAASGPEAGSAHREGNWRQNPPIVAFGFEKNWSRDL